MLLLACVVYAYTTQCSINNKYIFQNSVTSITKEMKNRFSKRQQNVGSKIIGWVSRFCYVCNLPFVHISISTAKIKSRASLWVIKKPPFIRGLRSLRPLFLFEFRIFLVRVRRRCRRRRIRFLRLFRVRAVAIRRRGWHGRRRSETNRHLRPGHRSSARA